MRYFGISLLAGLAIVSAPRSNHWLGRCLRHHGRAYCRRHHFDRRPAFRTSVVSWYRDDGGATASGWTARYGVADCGVMGYCYPFGTSIRFCLRGCVTATVDDHGPYVYGRVFDLDEATAQAIGFGGVGPVRWRIVR